MVVTHVGETCIQIGMGCQQDLEGSGLQRSGMELDRCPQGVYNVGFGMEQVRGLCRGVWSRSGGRGMALGLR